LSASQPATAFVQHLLGARRADARYAELADLKQSVQIANAAGGLHLHAGGRIVDH